MRPKEIIALGVPRGAPLEAAMEAVKVASQERQMKKGALREAIRRAADDPEGSRNDEIFGKVANALIELRQNRSAFVQRAEPAPYRRWGEDIDPGAVTQMQNACALPPAFKGALMPDAHVGYGLPIGGVLAVRDAVIPYAVGMDIACRMKLSVLDLPLSMLERKQGILEKALDCCTRFGVGAEFKEKRNHDVMDEDWSFSPVTRQHKDRARRQLGTSGSGNHFVEFGIFTLERAELGLDKGTYLALLSHSGSRGVGGAAAVHYSKLAMTIHKELPKNLMHLAWLDLAGEEGNEYWQTMTLMGKYAAANHALIHQSIVQYLGAEVLLDIENHHNFAWKERHFDRDTVVHRKGATPAHRGALGIIPGSMAAPGYVVRGKGAPESLCSAAHGAGRKMSRKAAEKRFTPADLKRFLNKRKVRLLSAGLDEAPMAYKDIDTVMAAQRELVEIIARFDPRLVKMAPAGERPED
jgi:tRNA-splicing ligase RtcB (3'-phosphate/5'-hydroxy nucleic acid ligase)